MRTLPTNTFQRAVQAARRIAPRGWSPFLTLLARHVPALQWYPVRLRDGSALVLDLRAPLSHGYFFHGGIPHGEGVLRLIQHLLSPGAVFVDVGAHVGFYAHAASRLVGAAGEVYAFEPHPVAYRALHGNARANVRVIAAAVGERSGEARFALRAEADTSSFAGAADTAAIVVPVVTLDSALAHAERLDLVKIDVEGYELSVLRGARETIRRHRPVVCFEYLGHYGTERGVTISDYRRFFDALDYRLHWLDSTGTNANGDLVRREVSSDILAIPLERSLDGPMIEQR